MTQQTTNIYQTIIVVLTISIGMQRKKNALILAMNVHKLIMVSVLNVKLQQHTMSLMECAVQMTNITMELLV